MEKLQASPMLSREGFEGKFEWDQSLHHAYLKERWGKPERQQVES